MPRKMAGLINMIADVPITLQLAGLATVLLLGITSVLCGARKRTSRFSVGEHPMAGFDVFLALILALALLLLGGLITYVFLALPS